MKADSVEQLAIALAWASDSQAVARIGRKPTDHWESLVRQDDLLRAHSSHGARDPSGRLVETSIPVPASMLVTEHWRARAHYVLEHLGPSHQHDPDDIVAIALAWWFDDIEGNDPTTHWNVIETDATNLQYHASRPRRGIRPANWDPEGQHRELLPRGRQHWRNLVPLARVP